MRTSGTMVQEASATPQRRQNMLRAVSRSGLSFSILFVWWIGLKVRGRGVVLLLVLLRLCVAKAAGLEFVHLCLMRWTITSSDVNCDFDFDFPHGRCACLLPSEQIYSVGRYVLAGLRSHITTQITHTTHPLSPLKKCISVSQRFIFVVLFYLYFFPP